tara:strand:- start:73 stop:558 length:486 start_codon:yes stop_codon:yes gene_type:complete
MPNFNKSKGFKLSGNPFQKNFPSSFKQEMTDAEIEAHIQRAKADFGSGAAVRTISEETSNRAEELGLMKHNEGGTKSIDSEKVNQLLKVYEKSKALRDDNPGAQREIRSIAVAYGMEDPYLRTTSREGRITPKSLDEQEGPIVTGAAQHGSKISLYPELFE